MPLGNPYPSLCHLAGKRVSPSLDRHELRPEHRRCPHLLILRNPLRIWSALGTCLLGIADAELGRAEEELAQRDLGRLKTARQA